MIAEINDSNMQEHISQGQSIIKFWAGWCGTCRLMAPKFKRLSDEEQYSGIKFLDIDAEKNPQARKWAAVTSLPFFATIRDGNILEASTAGKEEKIVAMLNDLKTHENSSH